MASQSDIVQLTKRLINCTGTRTLARKGDRTISLCGNGSSLRCTVLLGVTAAGQKLRPFVVFQGTATGRIANTEVGPLNLLTGNEHTVQAKAWIDQTAMNRWIQRVWAPFCATRPRTILLMDHFKVHKTAETQGPIQAMGTRIEMVLEGCTSRLQPLDVGINKPMKDRMREKQDAFLRNRVGNAKPSRQDISLWIAQCWAEITPEMIVNTWRHIGYVMN